MHITEHDTGVLFYLFYCKCGCCPSTLINPQIYLKIAASRSKTQIKRYKRRPRSAANDVWTVKQPSETPGGFSTVLVKKKKKETRLGGNETIRWWKKEKKKKQEKRRFSSFGRRDWQADSEGRAEVRKCFHLPLSLFFSLLPFPSSSISISLHLSLSSPLSLSLRYCSLRQELSWQGCLFLMFDISPLRRSPERTHRDECSAVFQRNILLLAGVSPPY